MKHLQIGEEKHERIQAGFRDWLEITGYSESTVYGMPHYVREFLHWIERSGFRLESLTTEKILLYFYQLRQRPRQRRSGALSPGYLLKHLQALKKLDEYLRATGQESFEMELVLPDQPRKLPEILTREEVQQLYSLTGDNPMGLRDRAMLAVYYGCGLRRTEGVQLDTTDYLPEKDLLYVRKGKNYRERYVPLTEGVKRDLCGYLEYGRPMLVKPNYEEGSAFFLSERGQRIQGQSLHNRLKALLEKAEIEKAITLHSLRHSIATHLWESGMKLSNIGRFLGHSTLDSTQIYTHIKRL